MEDDIQVNIGSIKHIEMNTSDLKFININHKKGGLVINISNVFLQLEDGTRTTQYNNKICFEFCDHEYYLKSNETSMELSINFDAELDEVSNTVSADYDIPKGLISFDILIKEKESDIKINTKKITLYLDESASGKSISVKGANSVVKWKSSNPKIANVVSDEYDETDYNSKATVYPGRKKGVCYIYATCQGKTVRCKVTTKGRNGIRLVGALTSYNKRKNEFCVEFINFSDKKITLCKTGATAIDGDYTVYDRNLKLNKTVTISSGAKKKVAFKVIGSITWWNYKDFCVNYSVIYRNKKYRLASDTETTWCRKKGKWKTIGDYNFNY